MVGVGVGVSSMGVGSNVGVLVAVTSGVLVAVTSGVLVAVAGSGVSMVAVASASGVAVSVLVGVAVAVGVLVDVLVGVLVMVAGGRVVATNWGGVAGNGVPAVDVVLGSVVGTAVSASGGWLGRAVFVEVGVKIEGSVGGIFGLASSLGGAVTNAKMPAQ